MSLLEVRDLVVDYRMGATVVHALRGVSLEVDEGQFIGVVGESGCGKSTLGTAVVGVLGPPGFIVGGSIRFRGVELVGLDAAQRRALRHRGLALVPQAGMNALNPVRSVEGHFRDVLAGTGVRHRAEVRARAVSLLEQVALAPSVLRSYPHELSGGMRQRVALALALALEPQLVVFDEPTTALDVLVQRSVVDTIRSLQQARGFAAIFISHDIGLVASLASRVDVMYAGEVVEAGPIERVVARPLHRYTEALLGCYADPRAEEVTVRGIPGSPPNLVAQIEGCAFAPRCGVASDECRCPLPTVTLDDQWARCVHPAVAAEGRSR